MTNVTNRPVSPTPKLPSEAEVLGYFKKVSNTGRWGANDELGTLNYITNKKRAEAASLVKLGVSVSCSRPIIKETAADIGVPFIHYMTGTGEGLRPGEPGRGGTGDFYGIQFHGTYYTHLDAHAHVFWEGQMYNGRPANLVTAPDGAKAGAVVVAKDGIVTRGVMLDIPKVRGVEWLEPGTPIFPQDLEAAEKSNGVRVQEGDALLVRTGHQKRRNTLGPWDASPRTGSFAGLQAACIPWLHERKISVLASDGGQDVVPHGYETTGLPLHTLIPVMGLWLLDFANLEELMAMCEQQRRWEFLFVTAPLRVVRGTGSPVNPLAIF